MPVQPPAAISSACWTPIGSFGGTLKDPTRVNVNGGAIALGASGARVLTTLICALRKRGGGRGVASVCIGGGMGIAVVVDV